jgi:hypothetical protein
VLRAEALADQFFLMAHGDRDGRPRLAPRVLGLGLAAALLGELVQVESIAVTSGRVRIARIDPPRDALARGVFEVLAAEARCHPVGVWLAFLGRRAAELVARRLVEAGLLRTVARRRLLGSRVDWVPTDMTAAASPGVRITARVMRGERLTVADAFLAGLVQATQLDPVVLWGLSGRETQYLDHRIQALPADLAELVAGTRAGVERAVMTHRT